MERTRNALVTGGEGSIGQEVVSQLLQRGIDVVSADRGRVRGQAAGAGGGAYRFVEYDAVSPGSEAAAIAAVDGDIDYLVLAAGIYPEAGIAETTDDGWRRCLDINLTAVFTFLRAAMGRLAPDASVVVLGSIAGARGSRGHAHYAASKAGLVGLVRSAMWELGEQRRINIVSPGVIANPMTDDLREAAGDALLAATPLGRFGRPSEVASVVGFLCSPASTFIQGENLHVNGGLHAG